MRGERTYRAITMAVACPACGSDVEVSERSLPVLAGSCPNCSREVLLLTNAAHAASPSGDAPVTAPAGDVAEGDESTETAVAFSVPHPGDDCDGSLTLELAAPDRLVGVCDECGEQIAFVLSTGRAPKMEFEEAERPRRAPRFGGEDSRPRGGPRFDEDRPPARPCRQCGGPLAFETGEDGTVTGRCKSCGNTFTLPRRRENRGYDRGGGDRRSSYGRGPPRRYGSRPPRDDRRGSDDRPRGRRPRRED